MWVDFWKIFPVASKTSFFENVGVFFFAKAIDFLICAGWCLPEVGDFFQSLDSQRNEYSLNSSRFKFHGISCAPLPT